MLAVIEKSQIGYEVRLDFHMKGSVKEVWSWLTENEKLKQWFAELSIEELRKGGRILFDMSDGTFEEMEILEMMEQSLLAFTWTEDAVSFELHKEAQGCLLIFKESITKLTSHTPKDIAGWHMCLKVISSLIEEQPVEFRQEEWEILYKEYVEIIKELQKNG
jgi:uncharacterized protein YndB with AHSA1/START domain